MQQQHGRRVGRAGLAIEDVEAVDRDGLVGDLVGGGRQGERAERQRAGGQEAMDFDHGGSVCYRSSSYLTVTHAM